MLDRDGVFVTSGGEGILTSVHGMFIDERENLYLPVMNSHVVLKYSSTGNLLMTLGTWDKPSETGWSGRYMDPVKQAAGPFHTPTDVAISLNGDISVAAGHSGGAPGRSGIVSVTTIFSKPAASRFS